jgi:putative cell wall-binding protein
MGRLWRLCRHNPVGTAVVILFVAAVAMSAVTSGDLRSSDIAAQGCNYTYNYYGCPTTSTSTTTTIVPGGNNTTTTIPDKTDRKAGSDRIETAIDISKDSYPNNGSAGAVVLARSDLYPDALAGTPFAVAKNAPLLLTPPPTLDPRTKAEIQRVLPAGGTVYMLGGPVALHTNIDAELVAAGFTVVRVEGPNRFSTATKIANALGDPKTVFETTGINFPDALCGGAAASKAGASVLLTIGTTQAPETADYLAAHPPNDKFAIGGPAAAADPSATPVVGTDRYDTCAKVATLFFPNPPVAGLATGEQFADALTGGAHIAKKGGPLLLTPKDTLAPQTQAYLTSHKTSITKLFVYGGTNAVSTPTENAANAALS